MARIKGKDFFKGNSLSKPAKLFRPTARVCAYPGCGREAHFGFGAFRKGGLWSCRDHRMEVENEAKKTNP